MTSTINKSLKKFVTTFTWTPQGAGTYNQIEVPTGISVDAIRSVIVDSGSTNAGAMVNFMENRRIVVGIFQINGISVSSISGALRIFYE